MTPYAALTGTVPELGVIVLALLAAAALLLTHTRARATATAAALVLAPTLLLADIWHSPQVATVHRHPLIALVVGLAGLAVLAVLARALVARPWLFALLTVAALPFRIPIQAGGTTSNLLVPLYAVIAAGSLATVWEAVARVPAPPGPAADARRAGPRWEMGGPARERDPGWVARMLAVTLVVYALGSLWSVNFEKALQQLVFFYAPFALLFARLTRVPWDGGLVRRCLRLAAALAVLFAAVGFVEYATKTIVLNPKLIAANDVHAYFTVNSVFFDPDIFGRFLALVMVGLAVAFFYERDPAEEPSARRLGLPALVLAVLWAGLVLTLSRSSLGALLVGLATVAALRFRATRTLAVVAAVVAVGAAAVAITPNTFGLNQGLNGASSGRANLVSGGLRLFGERPVFGYGSGSFVTEYRRHNPLTSTTLSASHTIPITIAAEQGIVGLIVYLALVLTALVTLLGGARGSPARAGVAALFLALVFHTQLYADFLEDPVTWTLLAVGVALAAQPAESSAADRVRRVRERALRRATAIRNPA